MNHRKPTAADIGKTVEACADGWHEDETNWGEYTLAGLWQSETETRFHVRDAKTGLVYVAAHCRVPYSSPDPIAELSMAADLLAEQGADEAARVLMLYLTLSDRDRKRLDNYQSGDSISIFRTLLDELEPTKRELILTKTNPEPQP